MPLGTGTHFNGPIYGDDRSAGGLCAEVPIDVVSRRQRCVYFEDFLINAGADANVDAGEGWALAVATGGTATLLVTAPTCRNGVCRLTPPAANDQGIVQFQHNQSGQFVVPGTTNDPIDGFFTQTEIAAEALIRLSDASASHWFWGLAATDATLMDPATGLLLATGADNMIGFHHVAEAQTQAGILGPDLNDIRLVSAGGGVANMQGTLASAAQFPRPVPADAAVDNILIALGLRIRGVSDVEWYINGRLVHRRTMTNNVVAATEWSPSFCNCSTGAATNLDIDYVWTCQTRG